MLLNIISEEIISIGEPVEIKAESLCPYYGVIFEDDGMTGYFYALDFRHKENAIMDALHIYNVEHVMDRTIPSKIQLAWSNDGQKAALLINNYPHAVFDFESRRGYCRTGFPPPSASWSKEGHAWDESALAVFN